MKKRGGGVSSHCHACARFLDVALTSHVGPTKQQCMSLFVFCLIKFNFIIPSPHLLVLATSERFLPAGGNFRVVRATGCN